jgi:Mu-like prophage I protein
MQSAICNRKSASDRHFAWQLFSAGPPVRRNGKKLRELPVAVCGSWVKDGRHFAISPQDLRDMVENFDKRKNEMLVIDYEHASEQPAIARGGPVPAAGWIHELFIDHGASTVSARNGNHAEVLKALVEWTPEANGLIEAGKYRFFSPSIDWGARDKETGKPQGATLTSGALTNHPFLEELPPLMLTDLTAASAAENHPEMGALKPGSDKGETKMEMKRLSIRKLEDGPHAGHHAVFCGDDLVGYMTDEDFSKYAQKHLPGAGGAVAGQGPRETAALSTLFAERVGVSGACLDDIRGLVEAGRLAQAQQTEAASRALILSEVVRDGRVHPERALELARDQKISLADYVAVQSAERAIERAVGQGKILPRDGHFFFRDALERPAEFAEFVERAAPLVRLGFAGIGSGEAVPVDQEVDLGVRRLIGEQKISYGKALKVLFREHPALEARYRAAHSRKIEAGGTPMEPGANAGITQ